MDNCNKISMEDFYARALPLITDARQRTVIYSYFFL